MHHIHPCAHIVHDLQCVCVCSMSPCIIERCVLSDLMRACRCVYVLVAADHPSGGDDGADGRGDVQSVSCASAGGVVV